MFEAASSTLTLQLSTPGWHSLNDGRVYFWTSPWSPIPDSVRQLAWEASDLARLPGHWAIVDLRGPAPVLTTDRQRSRQLLAGWSNGQWHVTDRIHSLRQHLPFLQNDPASRLFPHFLHTLGSQTLITSVWDTPAGSHMILDQTPPRSEPYVAYRASEEPLSDVRTYMEGFADALDTVFERLLDQTQGHQLVVPISAGLDSRLILTWLRRHNAQDVITYSYGRPSAGERATSTAVAAALDYPFEFVTSDKEAMAEAWRRSDTNTYMELAWGGTSLPHKQDWFAVRELVRRRLLRPDAIVMPGHTVAASAARHVLADSAFDIALVAKELAAANGHNLGRPSEVAEDSDFRSELERLAAWLNLGNGTRDNLTLWQAFAMRERQAKFITNSTRVYEYFGLGWALPLHEPEIWDARASGSDELTFGRLGYRALVEGAFAQHAPNSGSALPDPPRPTAKVPPRPPRKGSQNAVAKALYRAFSRRGSQFGLRSLHKQSLNRRISRLFTDKTSNGVGAEAFLAGRQGHSFQPFD